MPICVQFSDALEDTFLLALVASSSLKTTPTFRYADYGRVRRLFAKRSRPSTNTDASHSFFRRSDVIEDDT